MEEPATNEVVSSTKDREQQQKEAEFAAQMKLVEEEYQQFSGEVDISELEEAERQDETEAKQKDEMYPRDQETEYGDEVGQQSEGYSVEGSESPGEEIEERVQEKRRRQRKRKRSALGPDIDEIYELAAPKRVTIVSTKFKLHFVINHIFSNFEIDANQYLKNIELIVKKNIF